MTNSLHGRGRTGLLCGLAGAALGIAAGLAASEGIAETTPPTEHAGLAVEGLGVISEASMTATVGLEGHILQLREITIEPGGQIAQHDHATRPGLVKVIDGAWVEGRAEGETVFEAGSHEGIVEDENTVHWFYNRGDEPATAIVCDIVPAS